LEKVEEMRRVTGYGCCLLLVFLNVNVQPGFSGTFPQEKQTPKQKQGAKAQDSDNGDAQADDEVEEEPISEDLAPAAVQLDVSKASPLIQKLYQATRETKEQLILARLTEAKALLDNGTDVKAVDSSGRTALHWAVMGSSYNVKPTVLVAYEGIADTLIQKGAEINKEDVYQDTALDYLLYAPTFEIQTLLIENGASSGFLARVNHFLNGDEPGKSAKSDATAKVTRQADLAPGLTLSIRLDGPVYSDRSRTGDPVSATVTYPLCKGGENIQCNSGAYGDLLVPPGTKVNGTILFAARAPDKYSLPRMVLDFSNIVHSDGRRSALYARVIDVDNARETVRNNEILGIVQPHASRKASIAMAAMSAAMW
jgi:Ankyrin repeats (many copies)